jgi:glycosyltransferase involved in cell wall biosynthesis
VTVEPARRPQVAVVVSGWPRVSETFALNELLALRRAGMLASVFATKPGDPSLRQPGATELDALVEVLPEVDAAAQAEVVAARLAGSGLDALHGYFAHQPAEVASLAARRLGVPYGFSAHALDVRKVSPDALAARAAGAAVVVSCNPDAAKSIARLGTTPLLVRHGVDVRRFHATPLPHGDEWVVLGVGRLVEKKGFDVLVDALGRVDRPWRLRLVGDGPERARLEAAAFALGVSDRVELLGRRTHDELPALYAAADVVAVPSVVDRNGDRDGLPNVVLEAMASARPVVASDVAAISTAVHNGVNGLLVPARDPDALAQSLTALHDDRALAGRLGCRARAHAEERFDLRRCADELCRTLERTYA